MHQPEPVTPQATDFALALSLLLQTADRKTLRNCLSGERTLGALRDVLPGTLRWTLSARRLESHGRRLRAAGVGVVGVDDDGYPRLLSTIPDPPLALYYRGSLAVAEPPAVAIVGARRATAAGRTFARELAADLAAAGAAVVSGLALGVDASAHLGALEAGGATAAVLGSGVDRIQPASNLPLAERVLASGGLLISEYPPGTPAAPFRFPERNRIISGLSRGVVVVEASARSGSLITARLAAEQGREVMAVPGLPGYPSSSGGNRLLKNGAALVESAADVLLAIGAEVGGLERLLTVSSSRPAAPSLQRLLDLLDGRAQTLDELAAALDEPLETCAVHLTELELEGFVQRLAGGYIRRPSDF